MDDMVKDFLIETYDNLEKLDQDFIVLEQHPDDKERLSSIFRTIHTIKGVSGFLDLTKLMALAHAGENLLSKLRDGVMKLDEDRANALLKLVDGIRQILGSVETGSTEGTVDYTELAAHLNRLADPAAAPAVAAPTAESKPTSAVERKPEAVVAEAAASAASAPKTEVVAKTPEAGAKAGGEGAGLADASIRVDVEVLDRLMNLVGELVLTRNRLMLHPAVGSDTGFQGLAQSLNHLTSELQEGVMKTRMQPIGTLWAKLPRVVRDLSKLVGKTIRLEMEGQDTELDRTLIDALKDPMTHIVRNSIDHGVETPEGRIASGKPPEGVLTLRACHRSGNVVITVDDDGRGIDPVKIKAKAVEKGLITPAQAAQMSAADAVNLVFAAGFSTAEKVSNISGRGVGMDVVKTNIERIGGRVDLVSRLGVGLTLTVTIPLTLAIVPALVLSSGGTHFAIPQTALVELVRIKPEVIETVFDVPVYRLRGQILPLVYLNKIMQGETAPAAIAAPAVSAPTALSVLILQANDSRYGLVVDAIHNTEEIVVKPLSKHFSELPAYAGATILGDGRLALILDVIGIARLARLGQRAGAVDAKADQVLATDRVPLLIFVSPDDGRMAIRLDQVTRLEELPTSGIERIGTGETIQYRGTILPLVRVFALLAERRNEPRNPESGVPEGMLQVVVHTVRSADASAEGQRVGLVVGRILDTVEESLAMNKAGSRAGITGCLVIQGKVTELLDVDWVVRQAHPELSAQPELSA